MARRYSGLGSFGPGPASGTSGYGGSPSYGDQTHPSQREEWDTAGYVRDEDLADYTTQADLDAATQGFATQDDIDAALEGSAIDRDALIQDILDQVFAGGDMGAFDDPMGMGGMGESEITQIVEDWIANNAGTLTDQQMRDYVDAELISEERIQELVADGTLSQEQVDPWIDTAIEDVTTEVQQDIEDATSEFMTAEEINEAIANGTLTAEDVQRLIDDGLLDDEHIQSLIAQ